MPPYDVPTHSNPYCPHCCPVSQHPDSGGGPGASDMVNEISAAKLLAHSFARTPVQM